MSEFTAAAAYIGYYITFLQLAAITGVASVIILNASSDMFATELTGTQEPGTGRPIVAQKYRGWIADGCRSFVFVVSASLASTYSVLIFLITISTIVIALGTGCDDLMSLTTNNLKTSTQLKDTFVLGDPAGAPLIPATTQTEKIPVSTTGTSGIIGSKNIAADCLTLWVARHLPWTSTQLKIAIIRPSPLRTVFVFVVSMTIVVACWIAFLSTILRWSHMRRPDVLLM